MNNEKQLQKIKALNWIAIIVDIVFVVIASILFVIFFTAIFTPTENNALEFPEQVLPMTYDILGKTYSSGDVNLVVSMMAVFMIIGY